MFMFRAFYVATALIVGVGTVEGATVLVRAGGDLQAAINAAQPGDVLMLEAGATFTGNFILPVKTGTTFITVRSSAANDVLPAPGARITPASAALLPKIRSTNSGPALVTAAGAHHWRLQCLEFPNTMLGYGEIMRIGEGSLPQVALSQVPYDIEIDRVYLHGSDVYGQKRGIALNGRNVTVRDSYISDIKAIGFDSQAIAGWNGPGPFKVENNYLEAAGENVLLGGADPTILNLVTEDVTVRHNYFFKPLSWRNPVVPAPLGLTASGATVGGALQGGTYAYRVVARRPAGGGSIARSTASSEVSVTVPAGSNGMARISWSPVPSATEYRVYGRLPGSGTQYWTVTGTAFTDTGAAGVRESVPTTAGETWLVKNLFELKNARRVVIEQNVFENNWMNGQNGWAILFTPRNQDGACAWCVVEDVTFQSNLVRNVAGGVSILGIDSPNVSQQTNNVRILNNVFYGITTDLGGPGWFFLIGDEPRDITVEHNTIDFDGSTAVYAYGGTDTSPRKITGFRFANNAARHGEYGVNGAGSATGNAALAAYFPGSVVAGNWLQGGTASRYPAGNFFGGTFASAFVNLTAADYRPAPGSLLLSGSTDGAPIGADVAAVMSGILSVGAPTSLSGPSRPGRVRIIN